MQKNNNQIKERIQKLSAKINKLRYEYHVNICIFDNLKKGEV